jgi:hypothetical protein
MVEQEKPRFGNFYTGNATHRPHPWASKPLVLKKKGYWLNEISSLRFDWQISMQLFDNDTSSTTGNLKVMHILI